MTGRARRRTGQGRSHEHDERGAKDDERGVCRIHGKPSCGLAVRQVSGLCTAENMIAVFSDSEQRQTAQDKAILVPEADMRKVC